MEMRDDSIDYVYRDNLITRDGVSYDLRITEQKNAYDDAYDSSSGWMKDLVLCTNSSNAYREYKASDLSAVPTHPCKDDFGYENLKSGSIIYDIKNKIKYMYDEISDVWVEQ